MKLTRMIGYAALPVTILAFAACGASQSATSSSGAMTPSGMMSSAMSSPTGMMTPTATASPTGMMTPTGMATTAAMGTSTAMTTSAMSTSAAADAMSPGTFINYDDYMKSMAMYANSTVVYFFNATWCPECQAMTKDLMDPAKVPAGLTVVSVDYDTHQDLREKYGVTMQHTFVQVDQNGNAVATWSATQTSDIAAGVKK